MTRPSRENASLNGRDIYECANQLGGYVGPDTTHGLAVFLGRESEAACDLADEIVRLRSELAKAREALEWIAENSGDTYETNKGPFWVPDEAADRARAALEGKDE